MTDDARVHHSTWALLPWLANGRASPDERERAEAHLRECATCRAELAPERDAADQHELGEPQHGDHAEPQPRAGQRPPAAGRRHRHPRSKPA
jgi:anti-sigma factor RsiW